MYGFGDSPGGRRAVLEAYKEEAADIAEGKRRRPEEEEVEHGLPARKAPRKVGSAIPRGGGGVAGVHIAVWWCGRGQCWGVFGSQLFDFVAVVRFCCTSLFIC